ncbi:MAG: isoprenylcysteine carboxylmethyltransferase family protein [Candidatus Sericytochromatia bacterium]|nr:isoprenylcysteine carboxylmethyltransferase family protein [Candidatus Sericytochromatia bacterium]
MLPAPGAHLDSIANGAYACGVIWTVTEVRLMIAQRSRRTGASPQDRGSLAMIVVPAIAAIAYAGLDVWLHPYLPIPLGFRALGFPVFVAGLALRQWSIAVLGRFFTVDVAIHGEHRLIEEGPYRLLRHPSYTGFAMILLGIGLMAGKPMALALVLLAPLPGLIRRIQVEEQALRQAFGPSFDAYAKRTWRLMPGVF